MATVTVTVTQNNSRTGEVCGEEGHSKDWLHFVRCNEAATEGDRETAM